MASTPMDLDVSDNPSPANGTPTISSSLHITLMGMGGTSAITEIIDKFRPTKVSSRPSVSPEEEEMSRRGLRISLRAKTPKKRSITAASVKHPPHEQHNPLSSSRLTESISCDAFEEDVPACSYSKNEEVALSSNTSQLFKRDDIKDGRPQPHVLSLDFDDPGELLMTSVSDETIQIYSVKDGRHNKQLLSKKYGVKLAKFTHTSSSIVYASTKVNDAIRYLTTHDNSFVRYFEGHEGAVTCLAMHPGSDDFISCSKDNTVRLWNANTKNATGWLELNNPWLSAFDPSGQVFAIGSPPSGEILLYEHRNFDKAPFATFDIIENCAAADPAHVTKGWTKLEFSNDGRSILLGTNGEGHFLIDSFTGTLRAYLQRSTVGSSRLAAGEASAMNGSATSTPNLESSGDCCFTSDGRYVIGGSGKNILVWDTLGQVDETKVLKPLHIIEDERQAAVVAFNPRFNFFATADQGVVFWLPDSHA